MASYTITELPGRGRGLVANRDIQAGEIIIAEAPLLLTVAEEAKHTACAHCLRLLPPSPSPSQQPSQAVCAHCQQVAFCSPECAAAAAAKPWVHAPATCAAYARALPAAAAAANNDREAAAMMRFLIQALALRAAAANDPRDGRYAALLSLAEGSPSTTARALARAAELRPLLAEAVGDPSGCLGASVQELGALLAREAANAYGVMAPPGRRGARRLRGGGVYAACSAINHECLPNAARFDEFDAHAAALEAAAAAAQNGGTTAAAAAAAAASLTAAAAVAAAATGPSAYPANTVVTIRAMHALPAGTEIVQSYFPLNWGLDERRAQTRRVYGFDCACPRCATEAAPAWAAGGDGDGGGSDDDGEWETDDGSGDDEMASGSGSEEEDGGSEGGGNEGGSGSAEQQQQQQQQQKGAAAEPLDPTYLQLFLLKYMCPRRHCYGTMAPTLPGGDVLSCNVCSKTRTEAEFMAELGH